MARLIDAEHLEWNVKGIKCGTLTVKYLLWILKNQEPTVDAVPVVRCKDCKYYQHGRNADDWLWCMMNHHYTDEEKYCAWAESRKNERI